MDIGHIIDDQQERIIAGSTSFWFWHQYHFGWKSKKFTKDRADSMQSNKNTFIEAFRASRKTTLTRSFICRCIAYKIHPSIIVQSYEDTLSAEWVREVAKMLFKKSVVKDYGYLFPVEKKGDLEKKSASNFESTTGVKVAAKSMGQTIRGANTFDAEEEMSARPTLLILDDIDVNKSVMNIDIINQNERKITGETIGAMDPLNRKIIFLGNTINEDGIVPRFRKKYQNAETWDVFRQPLFGANGKNVRPEVFTDEVVQVLKDDGVIAWNQNYMLIPSTMGNGVFLRRYFDYFLQSHFEDPDSFLKKNDLRCGIFIDPATSTSKKSDDAAVVGLGQHTISHNFYLLYGHAEVGAKTRTYAAIITMYNNMVQDGFLPRFISVERSTINTKQTDFIEGLKAELIKFQINVPLYIYESKKNKNLRIQDNLEPVMSMQGLKFSRNLDKDFLLKTENQFLEFPVSDHDDVIDAISQAVEMLKNPNLGKKEGQPKKPPIFIDPRSGHRRTVGEIDLLSLNRLNHVNFRRN